VLGVVDDDVVKELDIRLLEAEPRRVGSQPSQHTAVGIERVDVVHEALAQIEHPQQVTVFEGSGQLLPDVLRGTLDRLELDDELVDRRAMV
jgi:hypothetical protein